MTRLRWVNGYLAMDEPSPEQKAWEAATGAVDVLARVEARLVAAGALTELRQLQGLSAQEMDVLVYREMSDPENARKNPQVVHQASYPVATIEGVSPSSCPQRSRAVVAA